MSCKRLINIGHNECQGKKGTSVTSETVLGPLMGMGLHFLSEYVCTKKRGQQILTLESGTSLFFLVCLGTKIKDPNPEANSY